MSGQAHTVYRTWDEDKKHRECVIRKLEKIQGLKALLQMWEEYPEHDHEYILELRRKLRCAENQYASMKP